jgi:DNA-binding beta-propeller fold protein YncE
MGQKLGHSSWTRMPLLPKLLFACIALAILGSSAAAQATLSACDNNIQNSSLAISPDERTAVASCSQRPEVIVYDLYTRKVRRVLDDFITPRKILFEPTGRYFYVSDSGFGVVKKIDTASLQTVSVLYAIPGAFGIAMSHDGRTLYVNNEGATVVAVFDLLSERRIAQITAYSEKPPGASPQDGSFLYLAHFGGQKIEVLDTTTNQITGEISGFNKIRGCSITRDGKTLLVVDSGAQSIAVVDLASRAIVINIPVGNGSGDLAISRDQRFVYFHDPRDNSLAVVALLPSHIATNPDFLEPAQGIVFSRDGSAAYVLSRDLSISRVNLSNNRIAYTIAPRSGTQAAQRLQPVKKRSGE